jgi:hypothetical protein
MQTPIHAETTVRCHKCGEIIPVTGEAVVVQTDELNFVATLEFDTSTLQRLEAHEDVHACRWCGDPMERRENESFASFRRRKHCSRSCAVSSQNRARARWARVTRRHGIH